MRTKQILWCAMRTLGKNLQLPEIKIKMSLQPNFDRIINILKSF